MNNVIPLESVHVAAPCNADWNRMAGNDRMRFCTSCEKNVYNLSGMSRREAEALIRIREGELCVRFARRADGTVITDDCPIGLRAARNMAHRSSRPIGVTLMVLLLPLAAASAMFAGYTTKWAIRMIFMNMPMPGLSMGSIGPSPAREEEPRLHWPVADDRECAHYSRTSSIR